MYLLDYSTFNHIYLPLFRYSLLSADKEEGGQTTGGQDGLSQGGITFMAAPDSSHRLLPADKEEGGQTTGGRDEPMGDKFHGSS